MVACCPIDLGALGSMAGMNDLKCATLPEFTMEELEGGVLVATFLQGSLGLVRICLGDVYQGAYALLLATLGFNARRPGPASNWLKTYVLITFINGTMGSIDLVQNMLLQNYPVFLLSLPVAVNLQHLVQLLVPGTSFLGAYCGWQHIKMQRRVAMEQYQRQLLMMMQQAPWPPPQLPFPLPGFSPSPAGFPGQLSDRAEEDAAPAVAGRLPTVAEESSSLEAGCA